MTQLCSGLEAALSIARRNYVRFGGAPRAGRVEGVEREVEVRQRGVCHERRHQRAHPHGRHACVQHQEVRVLGLVFRV